VDGVISNDGDCLLFGAQLVYTKFSLENLANGSDLRYDLNDLRSLVERSGSGDHSSNVERSAAMKFSRKDLIVFALLTGSDMAGGGLDNVGHKQALRFIQKCRRDYPLGEESAALDEMKSWARVAKANYIQVCVNVESDVQKKHEACCTRGEAIP
jgi:flap endonuclease GEN